MSAREVCTNAALMEIAITLLAHMAVFVAQDSKVMAGRAMTLMNARMGLTSATETQHAPTLKALTNVPARLGFMVTVMYVEMLTNVMMNHTAAVWMRLAATLWAPIRVHAMTVSVETVVYAVISMSAAMDLTFVALMPAASTSLVLTVAPAERGTVVMGDIVTVSTGSTMCNCWFSLSRHQC